MCPRSMAIRLRYQRLSGPTQTLLRTEGESERFEFKQNAVAVKQQVLVAAANAAVLEHLPKVTILVGVQERVDETTGAVSGEVIGLGDIDRSTETITAYGRDTYPVPVGLRIIQENLNTRKPILRLEVWPTRPPHYTQDGRRVTRYGASTRAITDEELVEMYLRREAQSFQSRFRETAEELIAELVGIRERLVKVHELTDHASGAAEDSIFFAEGVSADLDRVESRVEDILERPRHSEEVFVHLRLIRSQVLLSLRQLADKTLRDQVAEIVGPIIDRQPRVFDYLRNLREEAAWHDFLVALHPGDQEEDAESLIDAAQAVATSLEEPDRQTIREDLENAIFKWWHERRR